MRNLFLSLIFLWLLFPAQAGADPSSDLVGSGNGFYRAGKLAEALESYDGALKLAPDSPEILFDKGNAHFRSGEFEVAREEYGRAALLSGEGTLKAKAHFNFGCAANSEAVRDSEKADKKALQLLDLAIAHYKEARKLDSQYRSEAGRAIEIARRTISMIQNKVWVEKTPGQGIKRAPESRDDKSEVEPARNTTDQPEGETSGKADVKETPREALVRESAIHGNEAPRSDRETPAEVVQDEYKNSGKFRRFRKTDHSTVKDW